jgi:hypothetical protein
VCIGVFLYWGYKVYMHSSGIYRLMLIRRKNDSGEAWMVVYFEFGALASVHSSLCHLLLFMFFSEIIESIILIESIIWTCVFG